MTQKRTSNRLFPFGLGLFLVGLTGLGWSGFQYAFPSSLDLIAEKNVWFHAEFDLAKTGQTDLDLASILPQSLAEDLNPDRLSPWVGDKLSLSQISPQGSILGARIRNTREAKKFIEGFLLEGEELNQEKISLGTLYTPSFSSDRAFLKVRGWLLWSESRLALLSGVDPQNPMGKNLRLGLVNQDLPAQSLARVFVDFTQWTPPQSLNYNWEIYRPLLENLDQTIPALGLTLNQEKFALKLRTKILTQSVEPHTNRKKLANSTIPDLAYLAPKNTMFFLNSTQLFDKYQDTERFMASIDPQLELVFNGVVSAQVQSLFGSKIDPETDILAPLNQDYGLLFDFDDDLHFGMLARITNTQDTQTQLTETINQAREQFKPQTQELALPNGQTRTELVALENTEDTREEYEGVTYFVTGEETSWAYSFFDQYLILASSEDYLKKIIDTAQKRHQSLAENQDFRQTVVFDFAAAESYGFANISKLQSFSDWLEFTSPNEDFAAWNLSSIQNLRNLVFAQRGYPDATYLEAKITLDE